MRVADIYIYIYILDIDKPILGRAVRTPIHVPVTGPRHACVLLVMVAYRALGYVSPPVLYCACIAKSTTVLLYWRSLGSILLAITCE
jgi:hypothetical protein